jgi:hypothetical protein
MPLIERSTDKVINMKRRKANAQCQQLKTPAADESKIIMLNKSQTNNSRLRSSWPISTNNVRFFFKAIENKFCKF